MEIEFRAQHDSIKSFDPITLDPFSIITGTNGSGKTHFLKGIHEGKFIVIADGQRVPQSRIGYFDYNAFKQNIATQNSTSAQTGGQKTQAVDGLPQDIKNEFNQLVSDKISNGLTPDQMEQFKNFRWIYIDQHNPNLLTPEKWHPVDYVIQETKFDVAHDRDLWNGFFQLLKEVVAELDAKYKSNRWYLVAKQKRVGLLDLSANALNSKVSSLEELLKGVFEQYCELKYEFEHELTVRRVGGEDVDFDFEVENFNQLNKAPWLVLNEILKEYGCNGYSFDEADIPPPPSRQQPANINIRLRNQRGVVVPIEKLSSGEKTLFSLAVSLFSEKTNASLPYLLLLDEIDASLHPSMCKQLLDVLRKVFVAQQQVKIIMVTHSPSTIAHAHENETHVMSVSEDGSKHFVSREVRDDAINALTNGFMTLDQGINIFNNISKNVILISEGENKRFLDLAKDHLLNEDEKNQVFIVLHKNLGDGQLRIVYDLYRRINTEKRILYIWDCDYSGKFPTDGNQYNIPFLLKKHPINEYLDRGIEASFDERLFPNLALEEKKDNSGSVIGKGIKNKKKFFSELQRKHNSRENFSSFSSLFDYIKELVKAA